MSTVLIFLLLWTLSATCFIFGLYIRGLWDRPAKELVKKQTRPAHKHCKSFKDFENNNVTWVTK